jgi:hypothetical protein
VVVGEDSAGTVSVAFGTRDRLRASLEHLAPLGPPSPAVGSAFAHAAVRGRGLERSASSPELVALTDGLDGLDATLKLDPDALRLEIVAALAADHR